MPQSSTPRSLPGGDVARIAVVGAHLTGLPLNRELTERGARLVRTARTAPSYRLHALPGTVPEKPGLVRCADRTGQSIALEIWEMSMAAYGSFVAGIPAPLGIGTIELDDGSRVQGFLCEAIAVVNAPDVSSHGGWRAYIASKTPASIPVAEHT